MSTGLRCLDCSGVTTENSKSAICIFFLIRYGDSVVLITLTANLLSNVVDIDGKISKLAVSVILSSGVTVPVVFLSDGRSTKAVIVFVVSGGIAKASSVMTGWGFVVVPVEAVLTCNVNCGNYMRPCVVSMKTMLFLIKCNPIIGPVNSFITTKCLANIFSTTSNLIVAFVDGFSNWPLASCDRKWGKSSILKILFGIFFFKVSESFWPIALT